MCFECVPVSGVCVLAIVADWMVLIRNVNQDRLRSTS